MDSVLGHRPSNQLIGALNSATAMLQEIVSPSTSDLDSNTSCVESPEESSASSPLGEALSSPEPRRKAKRKTKERDNEELLAYLERSDEQFLQHSRELNEAILKKMDEASGAMLGLLERMVTVMERNQTSHS